MCLEVAGSGSQRPQGRACCSRLWAPQRTGGAWGEATVCRAGRSARLEGGRRKKTCPGPQEVFSHQAPSLPGPHGDQGEVLGGTRSRCPKSLAGWGQGQGEPARGFSPVEPVPLESPWSGASGSKCLRALGPGKQPLRYRPGPGHRTPWAPGSLWEGLGTLALGAARTALPRPPTQRGVRPEVMSSACLTWGLLASKHLLWGPWGARDNDPQARGSQASGQVPTGPLWAVRTRS